jgi:cell division transport system ATP-binding protein
MRRATDGQQGRRRRFRLRGDGGLTARERSERRIAERERARRRAAELEVLERGAAGGEVRVEGHTERGYGRAPVTTPQPQGEPAAALAAPAGAPPSRVLDAPPRDPDRTEVLPPAGDAHDDAPPGEIPVIEFREVTKVYDGGVVGLERATLRIGRGEFVFLVGPTGCGKSTFVRLLLRELEPTSGTIRVAGHDLAKMPRRKVPQLRRNVGTVFQDFKLLPNRTVYANVAYSLEVIGESRSSIRRKVPDILRLVGLSTKLHAYPDDLSGGEQQRVSIARAFVNHPPLLLADEPTGNLDPETSIGIMQLIYRINRTGTTVVVATHDREMVDKMRRRVVEMRDGRIIRDQASGLYGPEQETTRQFAVRLRTELGIGPEER